MAGFDRIKPPEQRIQQRKAKPAPDPEGRDAVFTGGDPDADEPVADPVHESRFRAEPPPDPRTMPPYDEGKAGAEQVELTEPAGRETPPEPDEPSGEASGGSAGATEHAEDDGAADSAGGKGLLHVECQHCGVTAPMQLTTALRRALPLAVVNPLRSHPVFATCPCGERRAWLKPTLRLPR